MTVTRLSAPPIEAGTPVEVRNSFNVEWGVGFVVEEVVGDGYRVRRERDGAVLPKVFLATDVRPSQPI